MYITKGINKGDLNLTVFGSYYGEPDEYKPILKEVERIFAEAGLDDEEIKQAGAAKGGMQTQNRNRR